MFKKQLIIVLPLLIGISLSAQLPTVTFSPHWLPQAQFAGYYMADKMGFYKAEGINVAIVHPSASVNAVELLKSGKTDIITLFLVSAISFKNKGIDLVNIGQLSQNSALLFVTRKDKNINKLSDLNGKKIGVWSSGFGEVGEAVINSNHYKVQWVPILSTINLFLIGGIDAMTVMSYNEYDQIINSGMNPDELNTFYFSDYGFNIPEDGLYCLNSTYTNHKDILAKFVRATLKGWEYAKDHRTETIDYVIELMNREHVPTNRTHQMWMLDKVLELIEPGNKNIAKGDLSESDFDKTQKMLIDNNFIKSTMTFSEFYKPVIKN